MADYSVTQLLTLINHQVESREFLGALLSKTEALMCITMDDGFFDYPRQILYHYLWVISDFIEQAIKSNQDGLDSLIKHSAIAI